MRFIRGPSSYWSPELAIIPTPEMRTFDPSAGADDGPTADRHANFVTHKGRVVPAR